MAHRITLDTNQFVAALMRPSQLATFLMVWEARRFTVVASTPLLDEYEFVLSYPKIAALIYPELLRAYRSHLIHEIDVVTLDNMPHVCRDPDDDKVVATALQGHADYLVSQDDDLYDPAVKSELDAKGVKLLSLQELIIALDRLNQ
jgi:uncharacterized protein